METTHPVLTAATSARTHRAEPRARERERQTRLPGWVVLLGVLLLAVSLVVAGVAMHTPGRTDGSGGAGSSSGAPDRRAVSVAYVDAEGGVRSLHPAVPGRVVRLPRAEGESVKKGDVLLQLDDRAAQALLREADLAHQAAEEKLEQVKQLVNQHPRQLEMLKAAVDMARTKVTQAEAQAKKAARLARGGLGGSSREDVEMATSAAEEARAGVRAAQAKLDALKATDPEAAVRMAKLDVAAKLEQKRKAQLGVDECTLRAPCDGTILRLFTREGEMLGPDPKVPAIQFAPAGPLIVRAEVEQEFAGLVKTGQTAEIEDDLAGGDHKWQGEVTQISKWFAPRRMIILEPRQFNDERTLEVIIRLKPDPQHPLRINQRVRVRIMGVE